MKVLSIDAWAEGEGGWTWNNWFHIGDVSKKEFESLTDNRKILAWFREKGYLGQGSQGQVGVEDDGYNVVVTKRSDGRPLYAIEYGVEY